LTVSPPGPEKRDVLLKDSLYSAIGLASASLEQQLDFNSFLETTLVQEVQIQDQGYNVLRRRIAIILGQWVPVKPDELNRNAIYQIFQHLLSKQDPLNDLVVRITAGRQLKNVLDPFEFSPTGFMPYAQSILQDLMSLIQEVELPETKMGLLESVRVLVVKMEHHVCTPSSTAVSVFANAPSDRAILGPDIGSTASIVGAIRRGASYETGHSNVNLVPYTFFEAGLHQVSLSCLALDQQFGRARLCKTSLFFGT
jgi:hypothetical protein